MRCYDFEYDGIRLSDLGYIICDFNSAGQETVTGSEITFNTVAVQNGTRNDLISTTYDSCLETTFQICKNPCKFEDESFNISSREYRDLMVWLNRKSFNKLKFFEENDDEYANYYFEASFNVGRIEAAGQTLGLELSVKTNRPYALHEPVTIVINNEESNGTADFVDISDDEGYIYPYMEVTVASAGNLTITNSIEDRSTYLANCTAGEVITFDYPLISSTDSSHELQNDFNWNFFRIANTFRNRKNELTISLPCTITMQYSPAVKIGL